MGAYYTELARGGEARATQSSRRRRPICRDAGTGMALLDAEAAKLSRR
jgi:hypothetical protein